MKQETAFKELKRRLKKARTYDPYSPAAARYEKNISQFCKKYNFSWKDVQRAHGWIK